MDYTRLIPAFIYVAVKHTDSNQVFDICHLNSRQERCQRSQKQLPQGVDYNNVKLPIETPKMLVPIYFTLQLAFSVHFAMHSPGNVNSP